ncbi:type II secretion system major pseudopilin GspG [bacterium]|nr:type II secretion system major pseudopilin GspG [bacterium]
MSKKGFTLIELLLVVVIISVLAAMVAPRLVGKSKEARVAAAKADIEAGIAIALELFELDNGRYPTSEEGLSALRGRPSDLESWKGPYIKKKVPADPWNNPYQYKCPGEHGDDYDLFSCGPDGVVGGGDDITNWEEAK